MAQPTSWTYLRHHRIKAGYTKLHLAAVVGTSVSHLSYVESGQRGFSPEMYSRVAKALNVDLDELIASAPRPVRDPDPDPVEAVAS